MSRRTALEQMVAVLCLNEYNFIMDGTRYYRMIIPLLSSDNKILSEIDFRSTDPYQMEKIYNCISTYTPDA